MVTQSALNNGKEVLNAPPRPAPWHRDLWQDLCERADRHQLPSTLLLNSVKGVGKRLFLTAFSERLLCHQPTSQGACGQCKSCHLLRSGHHPDAFILDDTAIKVDQVRQLIDFTLSTPQQGGKKVVILGPLESLNANSANALLKCLEEPPLYVHFLLFSHVVQQVMPTIRSRCMVFEAPSPLLPEATNWLASHAEGISDERLRECLELSGGAPVDALLWAEPKRMTSLESLIEPFNSVALGEGLPKDAFKGLSLDDLPWVLDWIIAHLQKAIALKFSELLNTAPKSLGSSHLSQGVDHTLRHMGVRRLFTILEETQGLKGQVLQGGNPNVALVLEQWTLRHLGN